MPKAILMKYKREILQKGYDLKDGHSGRGVYNAGVNPLSTLADISLGYATPSCLLTPSPSPPPAHSGSPQKKSYSCGNESPPPAHEIRISPRTLLYPFISGGGDSYDEEEEEEEYEKNFYFESEGERKKLLLFNARERKKFSADGFHLQNRPEDLRIDAKKKEKLNESGVRCPECGKVYSTSSNLARHRQIHRSIEDKKARQCPHCDKTYVSMPAFSMHIRTHTQGCKCPFCGKCFSRPWLLQGHIRTHTGEKPFRCNICEKAFADKSNLRAHIQTHSNTKPYVCSRCNKAFALKSYLYKHEESSCMKSLKRGRKPSSPSSAHPQQMFLDAWRQVALLSSNQ